MKGKKKHLPKGFVVLITCALCHLETTMANGTNVYRAKLPPQIVTVTKSRGAQALFGLLRQTHGRPSTTVVCDAQS